MRLSWRFDTKRKQRFSNTLTFDTGHSGLQAGRRHLLWRQGASLYFKKEQSKAIVYST